MNFEIKVIKNRKVVSTTQRSMISISCYGNPVRKVKITLEGYKVPYIYSNIPSR